MGEDEAGGVVGDSGLTRLTCLPDGACLGRLRGQVYTLERSMRRRERTEVERGGDRSGRARRPGSKKAA